MMIQLDDESLWLITEYERNCKNMFKIKFVIDNLLKSAYSLRKIGALIDDMLELGET